MMPFNTTLKKKKKKSISSIHYVDKAFLIFMEISIPKIMVSPSYLWLKVEFTTKRINVVNVKELISPTNNLVLFFIFYFFHLSTIVIDFFFLYCKH